MKLWAARESRASSDSQFVMLCSKRPILEKAVYVWPLGAVIKELFCYKQFKRATGLDIKPGECVQIELTGRRVEK